jgi:long-chain acyl-CoA synthetase
MLHDVDIPGEGAAMTGDRRWLEAYPPGVPHTLQPYPRISVFTMLERSARTFPDAVALAWLGRDLPYRLLLREVERFSAVLAGLGVGKGDRVALILPNSPQSVIAYCAALRLGAIVMSNNPLSTQREMQEQLRDCGAQVVVVLDLLWAGYAAVFETLRIRHVVVARLNDYMPFPKRQLAPVRFRKAQRAQGRPWPPVPKRAPVRWWTDLMRARRPIPPVAAVDPRADAAAIVYTGGTTGAPKGVVLSHSNLVANAMQASAWLGLRDASEAILGALPLYHSFGMLAMNVAILKAGKLIPIANPQDLRQVLEAIDSQQPSFIPSVPRMFIALNESPLTPKIQFTSVRACVAGGAPLPQAVARRFEQITHGAKLVEGYGLTEASPLTHANPVNGLTKPGTIGLPVPDTDCRIIDLHDPDKPVPPGQRGELCVRGPQIMLGYWHRPEETARTIINGWLHTGDVAVIDQDGYFHIVDRIKDTIIVSGFNVYPTEVEDVLYRHPKILRVCVAGVPHPDTGEAVKAYIVLRPGQHATPQEIITWCRDPKEGLTGYRAPTLIEFRDQLPEALLGKVLRRVLQEEERQKATAPKPSS